jgi:hypothetical protein
MSLLLLFGDSEPAAQPGYRSYFGFWIGGLSASTGAPATSTVVLVMQQTNMANLLDIVKKGATDRSVVLRIIDSTAGTPETGVVFNTAGIDLWYRREGAVKTSITEATLSALNDAHSDGGFLHIGDGEYRLDLPDAAVASGANHVDVGGTVTGMIVIGGRVRLVNYDPEDAVRLGLTALPNAAADAAGGLVISDAGGFDIDNRSLAAAAVTNANTVFNTDFATNYDATNDRWTVNVKTWNDFTTVALPLVPTTAGRTLDVSAGGEAGIDWANVGTPGSTVNLSATTVNLVNTLTTYTGNTVQTGDSYAIVNSGTHGNAAIKGFVDDIGVAGAGLTAIPWNASWDAEVQSEVDDALVAQNLDHLVKSAVDTDFATTVQANSVIGYLADNGAGYDRTTDSLEALRDRGDAAWITATGFSTHSAADVWAVGTRLLTAGTNIVLAKGVGVTGFTDIDAAGVRTAVGLASANLDTQLADLPTVAEFEARTLAAASYSTLTTAQVNAEADTALADVGVTLARMGVLTDWIDGGRLDLLLDGVVADGPNTPTRGVQYDDLEFMMVDASDLSTPETGVTVTATIGKDGGNFAACTNSVSEVSGGWYKITLTAAEMTANAIKVKFTGTGCAQRNIYFRTQPT